MGQGDVLARGAKSATFGPAKVSQAKWDAIWEPEPEVKQDGTLNPDQEPKQNCQVSKE